MADSLKIETEIPEASAVLDWLQAQQVLLQLSAIAKDYFVKQVDQEMFFTKADGSIASPFEQELEAAVGKKLQAITPWAHVKGEEGFQSKSINNDSPYEWLIDPVDGSISFSRGLDTHSFVATLVMHDTPLATVVYFPTLAREYHAYAGRGLFLNGARVSMQTPKNPNSLLIAISDYYTFTQVGRMGLVTAAQSLGWQIRTCTDLYGHTLVAHGACELKIDAACATWDRYPAELLVLEAGGATRFIPVDNPSDELAGTLLVYHPSLEGVVDALISQSAILA